jgi:hypothetical protein
VNKRGGGPSPFLNEMFGPDLREAARLSFEKILSIESQNKAIALPQHRHSFSELSQFLSCPISYKYAQVYGFSLPTYQMIQFGENIHSALNKIHLEWMNGEKPDDDHIAEIVEQSWQSTPKAHPSKEKELKSTAIRYLQTYAHDYSADLDRICQTEQPFSFSQERQVFQGKIDLLRHNEKDSLEIVDFKTSKPYPDELERDAFQLGLYSLGAIECLHQPITKMTVHFIGDKQQIKEFPWNDDRKVQIQERLQSIMDCIGNNEYAPNLKFCKYCQEFSKVSPYRK